MIAKITKGNAFAGLVKYILDPKKGTELLEVEGIRDSSSAKIIEDFQTQCLLNPRISKPVGHISLNFSAEDRDKLSESLMLEIAKKYMDKMGIKNTQYLIARHHDKEHFHLHIAFNRIDNAGRTISDKNDRFRSEKICKELTAEYGLYFAEGKKNVKRDRLRGADAVKYKIYDSLVKNVPLSKSWDDLIKRLNKEGIQVGFKTKGSTSKVEGVYFESDGMKFSGSKVDKKFSYFGIDRMFNPSQEINYKQEHVQRDVGCESTCLLPSFESYGGFNVDNPFIVPPRESDEEKKKKKRKKKKSTLRM